MTPVERKINHKEGKEHSKENHMKSYCCYYYYDYHYYKLSQHGERVIWDDNKTHKWELGEEKELEKKNSKKKMKRKNLRDEKEKKKQEQENEDRKHKPRRWRRLLA